MMRPGRGKTLVAIFPLYLNALSGQGCHLITVNDYLARRDSEWVGHILKFLGLKLRRHLARDRQHRSAARHTTRM